MSINTQGHVLKEQTMNIQMLSVCERKQGLGLLISRLKDSTRDTRARQVFLLL